MSMNWQCPFCGKHATLTVNSFDTAKGFVSTKDEGKDGDLTYGLGYFVCPNPDCKEYVLNIRICRRVHDQSVKHYAKYEDGPEILSVRLRPRGCGKRIPDYVPSQIREEYAEACLILQDSPRASAIFSRRCLQGLIRDYFGIRKETLYQEIKALQKKAAPDLWEAIDGIKEAGGIDKGCSKDISAVVETSRDAASALISLTELLIGETYVQDHVRKKRIEMAKNGSKLVDNEVDDFEMDIEE